MTPSRCRVRIEGGRALRGALVLPSDPQVAQRALALSAIANGETRIEGALSGAAIRSTLEVLRGLGVEIEVGDASTLVRGAGLRSLRAPAGALDAGSSPTALAIAVGLLSGQSFGTRVLVDAARGKSTRNQIVEALRARGAMVAEGVVHSTQVAQASASIPPRASIAVAPLVEGETLGAIEWVLREPDADAKTAILLSGLFTSGASAVAEPLLSADHTERWMTAMGAPVRRFGSMAGFDPSEWSGELTALGDVKLPGDLQIASVLAALASALEGSQVALDSVGFNPTRTGALDALRLFGARFSAMARGDLSANEPIARVAIESARLRGGPIGGELAVRAGGAQSALVIAGLRTSRGATLHDPALFSALQPAPFEQLARMLGVFGVAARTDADTLHLPPAGSAGSALRAAELEIDAQGAPELSLLALMLALLAPGTSVLEQMPDLDEEWPGLLGVLTKLGAGITSEPA